MKRKFGKFSKNKFPDVVKKLQGNSTHAYKKFGQNFLIDESHAEFMINGLDLKKGDFVIEIGPGMGALTQLLIKNENIAIEGGKINYLAVEIDSEKIQYLKTEFENVEIINESILDFDVEKYCKSKNIESYKIIGSLPFNISKKIIQKFSEINFRPQRAVFMVQKEVGEDYIVDVNEGSTFLSIYLSQFWKVEDSEIVPSVAFFPRPEVDGMNIVITPIYDHDFKFIKFVKMGFSQPRKKIGNILNLDKENEFYNKRPHELNLNGWKKLYTKLRIID